MIQSPWERATAVVTTEREGIRSHRQFTLSSTQQSVSIPVTEDDIPNLYVSVLLIKGRSDAAAAPAEEPIRWTLRDRGSERSGQTGLPSGLCRAESRRRQPSG